MIASGDLELSTPEGRVRLLPRRAALIGRPSSVKAVDVSVGCRWFSRGDKNLRLFAEGSEWFVEDLGSTNGSSIGDTILGLRKPYALPPGETLIEIGKRAGDTAPIAIRLQRSQASANAVVMTLVADESRLSDRNQESQWPSWREDLHTRWVVFDGRIGLGTAKDGAIVLEDAGAEKAAEIWFEHGFWIAPCANSPLTIADTQFLERAPLPDGAKLTIGAAQLRVSSLKPDAAQALTQTPSLRAKSG